MDSSHSVTRESQLISRQSQLAHLKGVASMNWPSLILSKRLNTKAYLLHHNSADIFQEHNLNSSMAVGARLDGGRFDVKRSPNFWNNVQSILDCNQHRSTWDMIRTEKKKRLKLHRRKMCWKWLDQSNTKIEQLSWNINITVETTLT